MLLKFNKVRQVRQSLSILSFIVLVIVATSVAWAVAQTSTAGTLRGTVVDSEGAVVWMAHVLIRADLTGRVQGIAAEQRLRTGRNGQFDAHLDPGFYDVCIMADAFAPICRKILIETRSITESRFRLEIDLDVIGRVADTFPTAKEPR